MKNTDQKSESSTNTSSTATDMLQKKVVSAEKSAQKAWEDHEKKVAAYEDALKQQSDKITLLGYLAATKIAKFTYKIKRVEYKLAKANWKADKKAAEKPGKVAKVAKKQASDKTNYKAPKDTTSKGKNSSGAVVSAAGTKKGKKHTKAQA